MRLPKKNRIFGIWEKIVLFRAKMIVQTNCSIQWKKNTQIYARWYSMTATMVYSNDSKFHFSPCYELNSLSSVQSIYNCLRSVLFELVLQVNRSATWPILSYIFLLTNITYVYFEKIQTPRVIRKLNTHCQYGSIRARVEFGRHFKNSLLQVWIVSNEFSSEN